MAKRGYILRYQLILKKLEQKPYSSLIEIQRYIDNQLELMQAHDEKLDVGISSRTLQRDFKEIRNTFNIDVEYNKKHKGYYISRNMASSQNFERMMEEFEILNALHLAQDMQPFIHFETRKPAGTENLYGLLHAIKNNLVINFTYEKYWADEISDRIAEPYALKEFKNRWYLLAKEGSGNMIKTFALDRLTNLTITNKKFSRIASFSVEKKFSNCFGIIGPEEEQEIEDIILSFHPEQGKYIKTLPLHETQELLVDSEDEIRIKLRLYTTFDFIMELLSYGDLVKVLQPKSLAAEIKKMHKNAAKV